MKQSNLTVVLVFILALWCQGTSSRKNDGKGKRKNRPSTTEKPSLLPETMFHSHHSFARPNLEDDDKPEVSFHDRVPPSRLMSSYSQGSASQPLFDENEFANTDHVKPPAHQCEDIRIDVCRGIGYNVTSMPNFVGHELQSDAEVQLQTFMPLVQYGCSSQLLFFLCSVYSPMCTEKVPVMIGPCRPLCENVRSRCEPVLQELGFPWPVALNCSKFVPENTVDHMCMEGPPPDEMINMSHNYDSPSPVDEHRHPPVYPPMPPPPPVFNPDFQDNSVVVAPHKPSISSFENNPYGSHSVMSVPTSPFDESSRKCSQYRNSNDYVYLELPRSRCVPKCDANVLFTVDNKYFVDYWTCVWACLALVSCSFTLISFAVAGRGSYGYPERSIIYISVCYSVYSLAYVYRAVVGRNTMACYHEGLDNVSLLVQEGAHNPHCTVSFLMLYYFGMAGAVWWLLLTITWSLSAALGWSPAKLSKHSQLFHTLAWTLPALQTLAALVMRAVDADELTGTCYVGNQDDDNLLKFVIMPMSFYLFAGISLLVFSFVFTRLYVVHEYCLHNDCPICRTPESVLLLNNEAGDQSSLNQHSPDLAGCGHFCRRLRNTCAAPPSNVLRAAGGPNGSGHSLLLPPHPSLMMNNNNNFCSTVSSTSSYSSNGSSKRPRLSPQMMPVAGPMVAPSQCAHSPMSPHSGKRFYIRRNQIPLLGLNNVSSKQNGFHLETSVASRQSLLRTAIFALFYTLPALCVLIAHVYEYSQRQTWLRRPSQSPSDIQMTDSVRPNFEVFNMKLFMSLVIGIKTGIWILTASTSFSLWNCFFARHFVKKSAHVPAYYIKEGSEIKTSMLEAQTLQANHHQPGSKPVGFGPQYMSQRQPGSAHPEQAPPLPLAFPSTEHFYFMNDFTIKPSMSCYNANRMDAPVNPCINNKLAAHFRTGNETAV